MLSVMLCAVISGGCGGSDSSAPEQTESLTDDTGSTDPNSGGRGNSDKVIDLSMIVDRGLRPFTYLVVDGMTLTGRPITGVILSVADGATITLRNVTINGEIWEMYNSTSTRLSCEGDATIILEGTNYVQTCYQAYPAIYVPEGHTLTIKGTGTLTAEGGEHGAGIGGGNNRPCGNIVIEEGRVEARGSGGAAGIGGGENSSCGDITIKDTVTKVTATRGERAPYSIGAGKGGTCGTVTLPDQVGPSSADQYIYPPDNQ